MLQFEMFNVTTNLDLGPLIIDTSTCRDARLVCFVIGLTGHNSQVTWERYVAVDLWSLMCTRMASYVIELNHPIEMQLLFICASSL